jgi:hypothetical protein
VLESLDNLVSKENLTVIAATLYAYVTFVGLVYSYAVYHVTGINLIALYEVGDFLLGGLRHPVMIAVVLVNIVLLTIIYFVSSYRTNKQSFAFFRYTYIFPGILYLAFPTFILISPYSSVRDCRQGPYDISFRKEGSGAGAWTSDSTLRGWLRAQRRNT